eukprot:gene12670-13877_t
MKSDSELEKDLLTPIEAWPVPFLGCMDNVEGGAPFCPMFCPLSLLCTNSIVGRVYSKVFDEQVVCMDMGPVGCCMCVAMIPLGIYTPSGGMGIYCCLSNYLRGEVARKYRLREEPLSKNGCLNFCLLGVCYPCSFFQMLSTIRYYEAKNRYQI